MKKNDKLVVILGVIILILASVGIYYWSGEIDEEVAKEEDFYNVIGVMSDNLPEAVLVSDSCPFNALAATPLAVNYDEDGKQCLIPLYVENVDEPSTAVTRLYQDQLDKYKVTRLTNYDSPKELSLDIAKEYWDSSEAALLIEYTEEGYCLGVSATPLASYMSIPVIVTDKLDGDVTQVLNDLGVKKTLVCGENLSGYGKVLKFENIDEIVDMIIEMLPERFKPHDIDYEINYITIANPRDAYKPEVIEYNDDEAYSGILKGGNALPSSLVRYLTTSPHEYIIKIPEGYKYCLVKVDIRNLEPVDQIEKFGDNILIMGKLTGYCRTLAGIPKRDSAGNIEEDRFHFETIFYDMEGEEFNIKLSSSYTTLDSGKYEMTVTYENLENPYYPFMVQMSSMAPYLAAHYKGIVFAKPEFAFAVYDGIEHNGQKLPGNTQVMYHPELIPVVNQHLYENVHLQINDLLSKIRKIDITETSGLEDLTEDCRENPFYVALIGDTAMLPQYYYRSPHSDPYRKPVSGAYATNVPSDFIYGNIDPEPYSMLPYDVDHVEDDLFMPQGYPEVENVVGRICGWDVQDASALIARTLFYDDVLDSIENEWKENALIMTGAGTEVQRLPFWNFIQGLLGHTDPMKFPSGEKLFLVQRIEKNFNSNGDFNVVTTERGKSQREGYSNEALWEIKTDGILNFLLFPALTIKMRQAYENWHSLLSPKWWLETLLTDESGIQGEELQETSNLILCDQHAIWFEIEHGDVLMHALGGPKIIYELLARYLPIMPFRTPLDGLGAYSVRDVSGMEMGPSVMMIEGCGSGKIDGLQPQNFLSNAYLHAGVNAYISPTTLSAFYGALEPRYGKDGVGFGIAGYIKTALDLKLKGIYPPVFFNQYIFEEATKDMFENDVTIGMALRNAKNDYLPAQYDITFRWTPPLSMPYSVPEDVRDTYLNDDLMPTAHDARYPVEKYSTIYQINLLGDPAFNPYEPVNEG